MDTIEDKIKIQSILDELEPLFEKAVKENLWFHCNYQDLWYSPAYLRQCHKEGRFIWGTVNWELLDPRKQLYNIESRILHTLNEYNRLKGQIEESGIECDAFTMTVNFSPVAEGEANNKKPGTDG